MYNFKAIITGVNGNKPGAALKENILATLAYFDKFQYPLTGNEIYLFLQNKYEQKEFDIALKFLTANLLVYQFGNYYLVKNDYSLISRRHQSNKKAAELIKIAGTISNVLIKFPYVRGIAISGSLAKGLADDDSTIELFIITAKNRLWIAHTVMRVLKKFVLMLNNQARFCTNYFIDEEQLEIVEKNFYTAIEIVTLIPLQGDTVIEQFYAANIWTRYYLPNKIMRISSAKPVRPYFFKTLFEAVFSGNIGNTIDNMLINLITRKG